MQWFVDSYSDIIVFYEATIYMTWGVFQYFQSGSIINSIMNFSLHRHDLGLNENKRESSLVHCTIALLLNNVKEWYLNDLQAWKYKNSKP